MRIDAMDAVAIMLVGSGIAYGSAINHPFTDLVVMKVATLPPTSDIGFIFQL
jgi:uncharacterized ion transporter superfamily protein YfcC